MTFYQSVWDLNANFHFCCNLWYSFSCCSCCEMMYSNRSEHSHRRQYGDRGSRQRDDYDDRWEERRETYRDLPQDPYHKYGADGHSNTERTNRSREYSDSPKRLYSKDSVSKDWSRKSPVRRRMSSPDWGAAEKKRRRYTEDNEDDYRYRREPEDKTFRQSPDSFSRLHLPKDFKHTLPQEEDFKYRKTSQDSRHRHRHEEFTYRPQHDDYRLSSGYYRDRGRHERSWDDSEERTRSQECSTKVRHNKHNMSLSIGKCDDAWWLSLKILMWFMCLIVLCLIIKYSSILSRVLANLERGMTALSQIMRIIIKIEQGFHWMNPVDRWVCFAGGNSDVENSVRPLWKVYFLVLHSECSTEGASVQWGVLLCVTVGWQRNSCVVSYGDECRMSKF